MDPDAALVLKTDAGVTPGAYTSKLTLSSSRTCSEPSRLSSPHKRAESVRSLGPPFDTAQMSE